MRADTPHYVMTQEPGPASASIASGHSELRLNVEFDKLERVQTQESGNHQDARWFSVELLLQPNFTIFHFFVYRNAFDYCI